MKFPFEMVPFWGTLLIFWGIESICYAKAYSESEVSQWPNKSSEKFISWEITNIKQETHFLKFSCYTSVYSASIKKYKWTTKTHLTPLIFIHFQTLLFSSNPSTHPNCASSNRAELNKQATVSSSLAAKSSFLWRWKMEWGIGWWFRWLELGGLPRKAPDLGNKSMILNNVQTLGEGIPVVCDQPPWSPCLDYVWNLYYI